MKVGMRVVIVDDDQLVALSLKTILEANEEISVVGTGNDGTEAVVLYEKERPDILLMDIQMKPMSGLATFYSSWTIGEMMQSALLLNFIVHSLSIVL